MSRYNVTPVKSYIAPRIFTGKNGGRVTLAMDQVENYKELSRIGIDFSPAYLKSAIQQYAMDDLNSGFTTASIGTPIQFLQNWLPGFVHEVTAARRADELMGVLNAGSWEDEQIVQGVMGPKNNVVPYGDYTNVPLASWNTNFVYRTVIRFEQGLKVGALEAARAARMRVDSAGEKRRSAALGLEIQRNLVGFNGYNSGANLTYGLLNDPGLPSYVTVANGASGFPQWSKKTALEIITDIQQAVSTLQTNSQDNVNPELVETTLAIPPQSLAYLNSVSTLVANSVRTWLAENYPKMRVVTAPQLYQANGGNSVFYLYADRPVPSYDDGSTDGGQTWLQVVPNKFIALGVEKQSKAFVEDYSNATAGAMLKRPWAVYRASSI